MIKALVIGEAEVGKTTLCLALEGRSANTYPTQMFRRIGCCIDTPSVYLENPDLYHALIVAEQQVDVILLVVSAVHGASSVPPGFAQVFSRPMFGVINKIDLAENDMAEAYRVLREAGVTEPPWVLSAKSGDGVAELKQWLLETTARRKSR